ncbi:MAG: hypothetical protein MSH18_09065, partial [Bacteroidales bacterium]|nr:hypothetical protein [Bacteroidales bacterium]
MSTQTKDSSEKKKVLEINVVDLFYYLLRNWLWFLISIALCLGYAYYKYVSTPRTYYSSVKAQVKS